MLSPRESKVLFFLNAGGTSRFIVENAMELRSKDFKQVNDSRILQPHSFIQRFMGA